MVHRQARSAWALQMPLLTVQTKSLSSSTVWSCSLPTVARITFDFTDRCALDPASCQIDLLTLTDGTSDLILDNENVPSGQYNWLRLMVNAKQNVRDSYIVVGGQEYELRIPSGDESGLKLNRGFVVPAGGMADFTIDFDLRKSVHDPVGSSDYILRPTLRIVDNADVGTLSGSVDPVTLLVVIAMVLSTCSSMARLVPLTTKTVTGGGPDPITSALVPDDGVHNYKVAFLSEGDYHIAFTCDAMADDPAVDDDSAAVSFLSEATVTVIAGANTVYDFLPADLKHCFHNLYERSFGRFILIGVKAHFSRILAVIVL